MLPLITLSIAASVLVPAAIQAAVPAALINPSYGFPLPGDYPAASNATSAGLALADRWLGESSYENPSAEIRSGLELSPLFQRISRQDVASENRDTDQSFGYPDVAGLSLSLPAFGWGVVLYAWQPVLRLEELAYQAGPLLSPAAVSQLASQREIRAGLAISHAMGPGRVGVSGEWVRRQDSYETHEVSGNPSAGDRFIDFDGEATGASFGYSYAKDPDKPWGKSFGAALHYGSELAVNGVLQEPAASPVPSGEFKATRDAEWSGGVSARVTVAPATRVVAGLSMRTGAEWAGFGFGTTGGASWSVGLDWKDAELPWGARFGIGQEANPGALERKAGLLSVGFTWVSGDLILDAGILHRNLSRADFAHSSDDRAVASMKIHF
jgi:hypothetical protein